jgi:CheY-like chemotaxis protein
LATLKDNFPPVWRHEHDMTPPVAASELIAHLRRALHHLYDPAELRRSPLLEMFGLPEPDDRVAALRKLLNNAINTITPDADTPAAANSRRYYELLTYRFVEQSSQREVAADMALSVRHLQRLEAAALQVLASQLADTYGLTLAPEDEPLPDVESDEAIQPPPTSQEIDFLQTAYPSELVSLSRLVDEATGTLAPLLQAQQLHVTTDFDPTLPRVWAQLIPLRQAMLHLLSLLAQAYPDGDLSVAGRRRPSDVLLLVEMTAPQPLPQVTEGLPLVGQLVGSSKGAFTHSWDNGLFRGEIRLPVRELTPIAAVDDNKDALQLIDRFLVGTRYQFIGISSPSEVMETIANGKVAAVVLDIMLPDIDGWSLLARIRQSTFGQDLPVIISTILPQERLALMLGANAFLHKPFTKEQLLALLDRLIPSPN